MEKKIITHKMILEAIKAMAEDGNMHIEDFSPELTDTAVAEFCANELNKMEKKRERDREASEKKKMEDAVLDAVRNAMTEDFQTVSDIVNTINNEEITNNKAIHRLTVLAKEGFIEKKEQYIDGRRVMTYRKV